MRYPTTFSADMKYLSQFYGWSDDEKAATRAAFTDNPSMVRFYERLAAAHRAGYDLEAAEGFVRLQTWCRERHLPDPFGEDMDPVALDASAEVSKEMIKKETQQGSNV